MVKTVLKPNDWNFKLKERNRGRMKLVIKLNKDQSTAFKNFTETMKPKEISEEDWLKALFFGGCEAISEKIAQQIQKSAEENPEQLEELGVSKPQDLVPKEFKVDPSVDPTSGIEIIT